jgi:exopolyphosphatase/guanosine-5'-triphosphate,3'-diphosphate pyrophosphatase
MRPIEALAERVQLGVGLHNGLLTREAIERGLACLTRFAQVLESIDVGRIRVVGTNALRVAKNRHEFTTPARAILGTVVDVVYGAEEARLAYLGVAHSLSDDTNSRLVIDIGGGSTEFIVGQKFEPQRMESLQMGCVSYNEKFFPDQAVNTANYRAAYRHAFIETTRIKHDYHAGKWTESIGASGTLQAIESILQLQGWSDSGITRAGLLALEERLLSFDSMPNIEIEGLNTNRRGVILSGTAIASAVFDTLNITTMRTSKGALREGVLYDLLGRLTHEDVRERTRNALMQRYAVDSKAAQLMQDQAHLIFSATCEQWNLQEREWAMLRWAASLLYIGKAISHKHYNRHSAYLLRNSDLPGFSQQEQEQLAILALTHMGKLNPQILLNTEEHDRATLLRLIIILRLAFRFKYAQELEELPDITITANAQTLGIIFPEGWLEKHPLTVSELTLEQRALAKLDVTLSVT